MEWTTEFPTKPGYYWLRNLSFKLKSDSPILHLPDPQIIEIAETHQYGGPEICFVGDPLIMLQEQLDTAEWYGPIDPPE
jgi:hypothetical protein